MNNSDKTNKLTSIVLLGCIIIICVTYLLFIIIKYTLKLFSSYKELFKGSSSNDKRSKMMKIYKSDEILDPDENPEYNINDPDSTISLDPDNEEYDNYDQYIKFGLE